MKPIIKIAFALLLVTGIPACEKPASDPLCPDLGPPSPSTVKVTRYGISEITTGSIEGSYYGQEVMAKDSLAIHLAPKTDYTVAEHVERKQPFSLINSAFACSPARYLVTKQKLLEFNITSSADFDAEHPAGTNLIDLFYTYDKKSNKSQLPAAIKDFASDLLVYESIIRFGKSPAIPGTHVLNFKVVLDDTSFVFQSGELKLK